MADEKIWAVAIILLIVGAGAGYFIGQSTAPTKEVEVEVPVEVPVYPLSGEIPIGVISATDTGMKYYPSMIELVEGEINDYIEKLGYDFKLKFYLENAKGSPTTAVEKLQTLSAMGIKVILGWTYSSHIKAAYDYLNEHKIVILSDHSTSPELALPDDYVYRLCPADTLRAPVLATVVDSMGIEAVVVIQRGDAYGDGMYNAFKPNFDAIGGKVVEHIRYSPEAKEFSAEIALANDKINEAIDTYGKEKVALLTIMFSDECLLMLPEANNYPTLMDVTWFDAEKPSRAPEAGELAVKAKLITCVDTSAVSPKYDEFRAKYMELIPEEPLTWYVNFYDSAWIAALSLLQTTKYDGEALKAIIPEVASQYFGASGWCNLNENGDKNSDFNVEMVQMVEGTAKFVPVGRYSLATGVISWTIPIEELK